MVVDDLKAKTLVPILKENIGREAHVMTDEAGQYRYRVSWENVLFTKALYIDWRQR